MLEDSEDSEDSKELEDNREVGDDELYDEEYYDQLGEDRESAQAAEIWANKFDATSIDFFFDHTLPHIWRWTKILGLMSILIAAIVALAFFSLIPGGIALTTPFLILTGVALLYTMAIAGLAVTWWISPPKPPVPEDNSWLGMVKGVGTYFSNKFDAIWTTFSSLINIKNFLIRQGEVFLFVGFSLGLYALCILPFISVLAIPITWPFLMILAIVIGVVSYLAGMQITSLMNPGQPQRPVAQQRQLQEEPRQQEEDQQLYPLEPQPQPPLSQQQQQQQQLPQQPGEQPQQPPQPQPQPSRPLQQQEQVQPPP